MSKDNDGMLVRFLFPDVEKSEKISQTQINNIKGVLTSNLIYSSLHYSSDDSHGNKDKKSSMNNINKEQNCCEGEKGGCISVMFSDSEESDVDDDVEDDEDDNEEETKLYCGHENNFGVPNEVINDIQIVVEKEMLTSSFSSLYSNSESPRNREKTPLPVYGSSNPVTEDGDEETDEEEHEYEDEYIFISEDVEDINKTFYSKEKDEN